MHDNFSIIIPTFQEAANIPDLAKQISQIDFAKRDFEVLLIDDNSQDGIHEVVNELSSYYPWLKLMVRKQKRDLSQSIITGFKAARYPILVTMDADLSHPVKEIPEMLALFDQEKVDMVIGSRYVKGGSTDQNWPFIRKITSKTAAYLANLVLDQPINDPLSGFLALRKTIFLASAPLNPVGWKIGLELIVKCHCKNIREIPIHFSQRLKGNSKLNLKIAFQYLHHIVRLIKYKIITIFASSV